MNKLKAGDTCYYFDQNSRVYKLNGVKSNSPYYIGYFRPIEIVSENEKEFVCKYGVINKKSLMYSLGRTKTKVYTEHERDETVYIEENRHKISELVRQVKSAAQLRAISAIINETK